MSLTQLQQEAINESINEHLKTHDRIAQQYLQVRANIVSLSQSDLSLPESKLQAQKLRYDLDTTWETYKAHLKTVTLQLDSLKSINSPFVDQLNSEYEGLLGHKLALNKSIKNMKEVQLPLLTKMKNIQLSFEKELNKDKASRGFSRTEVTKGLGPDKIDVKSLMVTPEQIEESFNDMELDLGDRSIKTYIEQELDSVKYARHHDQYLFKVSRVAFQDRSLTSIDQYDEAIGQLADDIAGLVNQSEAAKRKWLENADKLENVARMVSHSDV